MNLLAELEERLVCGDGAMGTLLLDRGVPVDRCLEELCVSDPDRIRAIHEEYVAAGARVIETNTFGANAIRLARFGLDNRVREINKAAVSLAKKAARDGAIVREITGRRFASSISERRLPALYRRSLRLSNGAGLFRESSSRDGRSRCAIDWRLLWNHASAHRCGGKGTCRSSTDKVETSPCNGTAQ